MSAQELAKLALIHGTGCVGAFATTCIALAPLKEMVRAKAVGSLNGFDTRQLPLLFVNFYIWTVYAVQVGDVWCFLASSPAAAIFLFNITSAITLLSQLDRTGAWHEASKEQRSRMLRRLEMQTVGGFLAVSFISCFLGKWELAGLEVLSDIFPVSSREEVLGLVGSMMAFVAFSRPITRLYTYCLRRDASPILLSGVFMVLFSNLLWTVYGISTDNPWVYVPNISGALVSAMQICVRLVFPGRVQRGPQAPSKECCVQDASLRLSSRQSLHEDYLLWQRDFFRWQSLAGDEDSIHAGLGEDIEDAGLLPNQISRNQ